MSDPSDKIKARARVALRAERAFGLDALPVQMTDVEIAEVEQTPRVATVPANQAAASDLFGKPIVPKAQAHSTPLPVVAKESFTSSPLSAEEKRCALAELDEKQVKGCVKCRLHEKRTNTVFGEGDPDAKIMFIGEGPGENEDIQGRPFVGRAGELLNKMIAGMGLKREQVYIANIVKCRPPNNREPAPDEVATCTPYLEKQIEIIRPAVIVTLGRPAIQHMLQQKISITRMRGQWQSWRGIRLMPTFHPAYILRNYTEETRAAVWSDLQQVLKELGLPIPSRAKR
ncbi:MAG TPA: uracil-DNA glycosylase [Tepidisphaeraceae bacterium]|nr:uracil-DNA glycosylase [Tepidisphaeraceae bacterium]